MRQINQAGIDLLKELEDLRLTAYKCPAGIWTIGIGHTGKDVRPSMRITEEKAIELLMSDLDWAEECVCNEVKVPLNDNQFAALVSFCFNVGVGAFHKSTLVKKLNSGNYLSVPEELSKWKYANGKELKGLAIRREKEGKLFQS